MFETYIASEQDIEALKDALHYLKKSELDFIFSKRELINDTFLVSYDSKFMYVMDIDGNLSQREHNTTISEDDLLGWRASVAISALREKLPKNDKNFISGPLLIPFTKTHENRRRNSIYTSRESYLATIIHEFGHVYYESIKSSWFSNYNYNLDVPKTAQDLYEGNAKNLEDIQINIPQHPVETEIFAYCTDYSAARLFWPEYKKEMDKDYLRIVTKYLDRESATKLDGEESVLDETHTGACVLGKIILDKYGDGWVDYILKN